MRLEEIINKYYNQLHENDFHILKYILNHRDTCYELGINSLADKCNVSRSSVLRLAQKLGFSGYSEFRVFLKWQEQEETAAGKSGVDSLQADIQETLKYAHSHDFSELCALIRRQERIFVYGTGTVQLNCADELQRMFLAVDKHLHVIRAQREFELVLSQVTERDLVIIISFSGDTPSLFPSVQTLVTKGVPFISLTNLKNNRLARMTPYNLYASSSEVALAGGIRTASFASFFIIGEMLFRQYADDQKNGSLH
ncbi:MurR/RpiR family transcriptional regulator [Ectobacillus ponti]|uniref:MurR/RpiR family transcriptional regulator n=1 Tax=Ectobacillus ponti TaxID=2961894 RepID=A0AA41XBM6_9BACI|nr:MurR/RpiR family transcriptional regulator [Ectobacillus ponti]MCP8969990.1 MurR/RpiR family transcriptional regulator [Ectobacillus ponti]